MTDFNEILQAVESHALASGLFSAVNGHEPISAPVDSGLSAAVWVQSVSPAPNASGLAATAVRVELFARIYTNAASEPLDAIDPSLLAAVDTLLGAYSGDFTIGGLVRNIDLLGAHGTPLRADAGYAQMPNGAMFRIMTIILPFIINDLWTQAP